MEWKRYKNFISLIVTILIVIWLVLKFIFKNQFSDFT